LVLVHTDCKEMDLCPIRAFVSPCYSKGVGQGLWYNTGVVYNDIQVVCRSSRL